MSFTTIYGDQTKEHERITDVCYAHVNKDKSIALKTISLSEHEAMSKAIKYVYGERVKRGAKHLSIVGRYAALNTMSGGRLRALNIQTISTYLN